jgi:glycerol kinase
MSKRPYILVYDHGTTGIRACLFDQQGKLVAQGYDKFEQLYPQPSWVEHRPQELWETTLRVTEAAFQQARCSWAEIDSVGITNQRETTILWNKTTGEPVYNAIVWQCRRTAGYCDTLRQQEKGLPERIQQKTGLMLDPYFSASKIHWILNHVPEAKRLAETGDLLFGTVDTWILWQLSGRKAHLTDPSNASRTMLYNIHFHQWDDELLELFNIPRSILPAVVPSSGQCCLMDTDLTQGIAVPISGLIGDQQSALFGQRCFTPGTAKSTYGTGAFLMMNLGAANIGEQACPSQKGLLTTLGCGESGKVAYAMEGAIFTAGATLEWLQRELGVFQDPKELDGMAMSLPSNEGVYLVPAFAGLAAPYWDADARGAIFGLTQGAGKNHLARAALEAMAYQTWEVFEAMQKEAGMALSCLQVDGGVSRSRFLTQFLADILQIPVVRSDSSESTALGAAYLAGLATGFWQSTHEISQLPQTLETFEPQMSLTQRDELLSGWLAVIPKVLSHKTDIEVNADKNKAVSVIS